MGKVREYIKSVFKVGGSMVIPLPADYIEKHKINAGDQFRVLIDGYVHLRPIKEDVKSLERKAKKAQRDLAKVTQS